MSKKEKNLFDIQEYTKSINGFIDKEMARIYHSQDMQFIDGALKASVRFGFDFNEERIKKWLEFCNKMDNVDKTDLVDIAIRNKFESLYKRIKDLEYENGELKERIGLLEEDWED